MVLYYIYRLPYPQSAESVLSSGEFNVHTLQGSDFRNGLNVPGPVILGIEQEFDTWSSILAVFSVRICQDEEEFKENQEGEEDDCFSRTRT